MLEDLDTAQSLCNQYLQELAQMIASSPLLLAEDSAIASSQIAQISSLVEIARFLGGIPCL